MKDNYSGQYDSEWKCCSKFENSGDFHEFISNLHDQLMEYCGLEDSNIKLELRRDNIKEALENE